MKASRNTLVSMTGYGQANGLIQGWSIEIEITSLNGRFLDILANLPPAIEPLEYSMRDIIQRKIKRGRINLRVKMKREENQRTLSINIALLSDILDKLSQIKLRHKGDIAVDIGTILQLPGIVSYNDAIQDDERFREEFIFLFKKAVDGLNRMKLKEGERLAKELVKRIERLGAIEKSIRNLKKKEIATEKKRIKKEMQSLDLEKPPNEISLLLARLDISEELTRISSHLRMLRSLMNSRRHPKGKRLDFICQELHREATTLSQKSISPKIISLSIEMREEIERMREQIRNVE